MLIRALIKLNLDYTQGISKLDSLLKAFIIDVTAH